MKKKGYSSIKADLNVNRREFLKLGTVAGAGIVLGTPEAWSQSQDNRQPPEKPATNISEIKKIPKKPQSIPGPCPGKVIEVCDNSVLKEKQFVPEVVENMFKKGITGLTGKSLKDSFKLLFKPEDVIGIKVNPVGAGLISTRLELVDAVIKWLSDNGVKKNNIIIWDRFDYMLADAGFTQKRFPGIGIEGLQTMDEKAISTKDNSKWFVNGSHISEKNFDKNVYYWVDVEAPKSMDYLNQHVFNGKYSYFGKLITQKLTKIINIPVFKNTGNGISMATKNIGYGAICNTNRLHKPLFFDVCTEVCLFPDIRDKMVLNITDGLRGQYNGGPMAAGQFVYDYNTLFFATDPIAIDTVCHNLMVKKRKDMGISVNEHPRFTEYLHYGQSLDLGIADPMKINHITL